MRAARWKLHMLIDPIYKSGKISRSDLYKKASKILGKEYHTGETKSIEEMREAYKVFLKIKKKLTN